MSDGTEVPIWLNNRDTQHCNLFFPLGWGGRDASTDTKSCKLSNRATFSPIIPIDKGKQSIAVYYQL